jgi:hypothetical protein
MWLIVVIHKYTEAYIKLLNKFRPVEANAVRDTMVQKINSMLSVFSKQLRLRKIRSLT